MLVAYTSLTVQSPYHSLGLSTHRFRKITFVSCGNRRTFASYKRTKGLEFNPSNIDKTSARKYKN